MKTRYTWLPLVATVLLWSGVFGQTQQQLKRMAQGKEGVSPDEVVSFKSDVKYSDAIKSLGELSKKLVGKIIVDSSPMRSTDQNIGINIESMFWRDAFELILRSNKLWYNEMPEYFEIVSIADVGKPSALGAEKVQPAGGAAAAPGQPMQNVVAVVDSGPIIARLPEVTVSSIFVDLNTTKIRQSGFDFSIFRGKDLNLGVEFTGTTNVSSTIFGATVKPSGSKVAVDISAALKIFESEQFGEVIARPQVTVRSGSPGRVQIGQDFSVKQKDFSGNITDQFFSTGTILLVRPRIFNVGNLQFIDLSVNVERSNVTPGEVSTIINKTNATSSLTLLNGEESYVGGLYTNEESTVREGIPLLKDLPWWFFGLRYLFGYDGKTVTRKELLVIIKAELVPLVEDRAAQKVARDVQQDKLREIRQDLDKRTKKN